MKASAAVVALLLSTSALPLAAQAHDHDDHGHHGKHKEVFWDGPCKVERKYEKHGRVKEKRECRPQEVYVQPAPVMVQPAPVLVQPQPGVVIQATGAMRLP